MPQRTAEEIIREGLEGMKKDLVAQIEAVKKDASDASAEKNKQLTDKLTEVDGKLVALTDRVNAANRNSLPGTEEDGKKFSFLRAALLHHPTLGRDMYRRDKEFGYEIEVEQNMIKQRDSVAADGTKGGYTIPTELANMVIEPAIAAMPLFQIGMTVLRDLQGYVEIPEMTSRGTAGHTSEVGTPTKVNLAWGLKSLAPHRAAGYAILSNRLERMSSIGYESWVRQELIKTLQLIMHEKMITGTGTNNEIRGIDNVSGMTSTSVLSSEGQFTVREASDMMVDLEEADIDISGGSMGFLMRPIVLQGMMIQRLHFYTGQTTGKGFVFAPLFSKVQMEDAIGAKIAKSTHVAKTASGSNYISKVTYGDWSRAMLALWTGLTVRASSEASDGTVHAFIQGAMMILAEQDYDFLVTRPDAFCRTSNAYANRSAWDQA